MIGLPVTCISTGTRHDAQATPSAGSIHCCRRTASSMSLRSLLRSSKAVSQSCMRMEQESFPHIALITFLWSEGACEGGRNGPGDRIGDKREEGKRVGREWE